MSDFAGFPTTALDFYDDLEADNSKSFFTAHRAIYDNDVRAPMLALMADLEREFGEAKVYRPYRDVRYAKDKTPYKTGQGAFVRHATSSGWYAQIDASGFRVGAGFYDAAAPVLARYRRSVDDEVRGLQLSRMLTRLTRSGWTVGGDRLKTSPRGYDAEHPRIELLRHRSLVVTRHYGYDGLDTADLLDRVRRDWRSARPLVLWVATNATGQSDDGS